MIENWLSSIGFDPLLPWLWVGLLTGAAGLSAMFATGFRLKSDFQRLLAALFLGLALSGPQWVSEDREALPDTVLILKDASTSMQLETRAETANEVEVALRDRLTALGNVDIITATIPMNVPSADNYFVVVEIDRKCEHPANNNQSDEIPIQIDPATSGT